VTFIARGANLEALRTRGLSIKSATLGDFVSPIDATDDTATIGIVDLVLVCVKTYDLDAAAARLGPLIGPGTVVLPLQNGIDGAERLTKMVDRTAVVGGVAYARHLEKSSIRALT
jgi:2-dehydropantoate 2-reductase